MKFTKFNRRSFLMSSGALAAGALLPVRVKANETVDPQMGSAKIREVKTYRLKDALFVCIVAENGTTGWGEASPAAGAVVESFIQTTLKKTLIGRDAWDAEPIWDDLYFGNQALGRSGAMMYAISAIDIALWDLKGKLTGLPLHKLLGGDYRSKIRAYASVNNNGKTAKETADWAAKLVGLGFTAIKLAVNHTTRAADRSTDQTLEYAKAIRKAIGENVDFWVDSGNVYTAARAIELGRRLRDEAGIVYFEEPVSTLNLPELAQVCEALDFPVIAGVEEHSLWQFRDLIDNGKVGVLNPDVTRSGGLTAARRIAALAQATSRQFILHSTRPAFAVAASLHLAASISNCGPYIQFMDTSAFPEIISATRAAYEFKEGLLRVPNVPGLGIEPDEAAIRRLVVS